MTSATTNISDSINELVGTFAVRTTGDSDIIASDKLIAIDTSNNRLGINTLDPSFEIHIENGTLSTSNIDISGNITGSIDLSNNNMNPLQIVRFIIPEDSNNLVSGQIYKDINGFLKIK